MIDEIRERLEAGDPHMAGFEITGLELTLAPGGEIETRETANVVGGFLVTHRMLSMFKRKG